MMLSINLLVTALLDKMREKDKRLHMTWSFYLTLFASIIWPMPWPFVAVFLLGFAKECWDSRFGSGFCFFDIFANIIGSGFAIIFATAFRGTIFEL